MGFRKKGKTDSNTILGMVLLEDENPFDKSLLLRELDGKYSLQAVDIDGDDQAFTFTVQKESFALLFISHPVPHSDIEGTAEYAYNWTTASNDLKEHRAHIIVSVLQGTSDQVKRFKLFSQVVSALLSITNSLGVYQGNQSLLIRGDDYLWEAEVLNEHDLPLNLWIYFGLRQENGLNSGYTYGLTAFNKAELEIIDSKASLEDIRGFLFNIAYYVLENDIGLKDGQTCGLSENERVLIHESKGRFVPGNAFRLQYLSS